MIFGDAASGKSSFAEKLAEIEDLPVVHLDKVMDSIGRTARRDIGEYIKDIASQSDWIIEGNAFTKDADYRIKQADIIYVFDFNRFATLANHTRRYMKLRARREIRKGSESSDLNLRYFIPYIIFKFPPRKKRALQLARSQGSDVVVFRRYREIDKYLEKKTSVEKSS